MLSIERSCAECATMFILRSVNNRYCSTQCSRAVRARRSKRYKEANRDRLLAYWRHYNATHERRRSPGARHRERERDRLPHRTGRSKEWFKKNPERARELWARRYARKKTATVEPVNPLIVFDRDRGVCWLCKKKVTRANMSIDHVIPLASGGEHSYRNIRLSHLRCNQQKNAAHLTLF